MDVRSAHNWSSSQGNVTGYAWSHYFSNGYQYCYNKSSSLQVRLVRTFGYLSINSDLIDDAPKIGDVCKLRSGGPTMTVVAAINNETVVVNWFDEAGTLNSSTFYIKMLGWGMEKRAN